MSDPLSVLLRHAGTFEGRGVNHEDEAYTHRLTLRPVLGDRGLEITASATGDDGTVY